jgi:phenylalanyl-tRNA synthetase beta chain
MDHNLFPKLIPSLKSNIKVKNGLANHISLLEGEALEGESDFQTRLLLIKSNISPINKTVDLTNMALLLFGQPVHVYDQELVGDNFDCKLYTGDLETINDVKIQVKKGLTIFSDDKPVSLAGIIGLKNTMVTSKTKKVIFEIANFDPKYIRRTSKESKIENSTTIRNNKSMSLNVIPLTINFLQNSLKKFSNVINELNIKEQTIFLEDSEIIDYAGFDIIKHKEYKNSIIFLKNLGYNIKDNKYTIPYYRYDIENQFDIIEDLFRGFGYNNIPKVQPKILSSLISSDNSLKNSLVHQNYTEIITYSLQDDKYNTFNPFGFNRSVKLLNPISNKRMTYRFTLIKSMSKIAIKNLKYKIEKFSLFEVGNINGYLVNKHLALLSTIKSLDQMKTDLLTILNPYGIVEFKRTNYEHLHEGMTANIFLDKKYVGFIGKFRPSYMKSSFLIAEIKLPPIKKLFEESKNIEKEQLIDRD